MKRMRVLKQSSSSTNTKGFTLIELVIVMAILAILAVLAIGAVTVARQQARRTRLLDDAKMIKTAVEAYYAKNRSLPLPVSAASGDNNDRGAYQLLMTPEQLANLDPSNPSGGGTLNSYMRDPANPPTNPSKEGSGGNVCYNKLSNGVGYNLWVVSEETAAQINCTNNNNKCTCGYGSVPTGDRLNVN